MHAYINFIEMSGFWNSEWDICKKIFHLWDSLDLKPGQEKNSKLKKKTFLAFVFHDSEMHVEFMHL